MNKRCLKKTILGKFVVLPHQVFATESCFWCFFFSFDFDLIMFMLSRVLLRHSFSTSSMQFQKRGCLYSKTWRCQKKTSSRWTKCENACWKTMLPLYAIRTQKYLCLTSVLGDYQQGSLGIIYYPPPQLNSSLLGPLKPPGWHDQFRGVFAARLEKTVLEIPTSYLAPLEAPEALKLC